MFVFSTLVQFPRNDLATLLSSIWIIAGKCDDCMIADAELVCNEVSGAEDNELTFAHNSDATGKLFCFFEVMGGEDNAALFARYVFEDVPDGLSRVRV